MQTTIRCTPICARYGVPTLFAVCRCLYRTRLLGCYILTLEACRRYRSACCQSPLANVCETSCCLLPADTCLAPSLRAPWASRPPCPMSTSLLNSQVCTLSATPSSLPPRHAVPPGDDVLYRETGALPHHLLGLPCSSDTMREWPRHSPILLNLPVCGPSLPVRPTFMLLPQWLSHM